MDHMGHFCGVFARTFVGFLPVVGLANLIEILYSALCEVIAKFYVL